MRVAEFQALIRDLYFAKDERRGPDRTFLWLVEEIGETSVALRDDDREALADELADVVAWTASLANLKGIDLEAALARKYPDRCKRCGAKPCACAEP